MKKIISLLLVLLLAFLCSFSAFAADNNSTACGKTIVTEGDWTYAAINGGTYWGIDDYLGEGGNVVIPRLFRDKMVVSIGSYCFWDNTTVTDVVTSSPLWTVDDYAFLSCTSLKSFECNFALKEIGVGAFMNTSSLKKINLEKSVVTEIKAHTFMNSGLSRVKLPSTCTKLGEYSFAQCESLYSVFIPDSVMEIADTAFSKSNNLVIVCSADSYAAEYAQANNIEWATPENFVIGDASGNNEVTIRDATFIQLFLASLAELDKKAFARSDVNRDGKVNIRDVTYIQMYRADLIDSFDDI